MVKRSVSGRMLEMDRQIVDYTRLPANKTTWPLHKLLNKTILENSDSKNHLNDFDDTMVNLYNGKAKMTSSKSCITNEQAVSIESINNASESPSRVTADNSVIFSSLHHIPVPAFSINKQGDILHWNQEMSELTGYPDEDVKGMNLFTSPLFEFTPNFLESYTADELCRSDGNPGTLSSERVECHLKPKSNARHLHLCLKLSSAVTTNDAVIVIFVKELTSDRLEIRRFGEPLSQINIPSVDVETSVQPETDKLVIEIDQNFNIRYCNHYTSSLFRDSNRSLFGENIFRYLNLSVSREFLYDSVIVNRSVISDIKVDVNLSSGEEKIFLVDISPQVTDAKDSAKSRVSGISLVGNDITKAADYYRNAHKRAKEFEQLLDGTESLCFGVDMDGKINEWNFSMVDIFGFSTEDMMGKNFVLELVSSRRQPGVQSVIEVAYNGGCTTNFELEIRSRWGQSRFVLATVAPRRCHINRHVIGGMFIGQDVTESLEHDHAVASMVCELRQLIDTANTPIFGIDPDGDVNEWNMKTAELTGYSKEEAFDFNLVENFIVPSMQDAVQAAIDNALAGEGTSNFELEFQTKSNEHRHLLVNITSRRDYEGAVVGVVFVCQDVTEAAQHDRAVAGMAAELRQLIDTANAPIFGIDVDGRVNEWNRSIQEITGYSKEETFDESLLHAYIAPSTRERVREVFKRAMQGHETKNCELEFITKSGESRFLLVNATTRRDPDSNIVGVFGLGQDVTEDRIHEEALRELHSLQAAQAAKVETERNMTAYFAHELRNPVSAIDSALDVMPEDLPESAKTLVHGMKLCTTFMSSIMNNLLDVRKMEEGKMTLKSSPTCLSALVGRVHTMLRPSVKKGVAFEIDCQTNGKDWVLADEHRIQQVFTNVITNAMKYTVTGSIILRIGWEDDMVKFECIDTGPGIPKSEQENLFQRFVQRGGAPGTGLGLVIAKHLVDLTSGTIRFESDPTIKAGTTCMVKMKLPLCPSPDADVDFEVAVTMIEEPLRILIIDDLKINRSMLSRRLRQRICPSSKITEAMNGESAIEICKTQRFDVIIVDQYMEEAGGVLVGTDVVYAMRRMKIDAIIIGCSGNDLSDEFAQAGADWVWQKPMPTNEKIIAQIREALEKKGKPRREDSRPV